MHNSVPNIRDVLLITIVYGNFGACADSLYQAISQLWGSGLEARLKYPVTLMNLLIMLQQVSVMVT